MSDRFILGHLRQLPPFKQLSQEQLQTLAAATQIMRFEAGTTIFVEGQQSAGMYVFISGRGILTRFNPATGQEEQVAQVAAGQYLNEGALYQEMRESASLRVAEQSIVLVLSRRTFASLLNRAPEIRANLRVPTAQGSAPMPTTAPEIVRQRMQTSGGVGGVSPALSEAPRTSPKRLFTGQRDDETVKHIFKRHQWAFLRHYWLPILLMIAAVIGGAAVGAQIAVLGIAIWGLGLILPGLMMVYLYFEWRDDLLVITDQRVVRVWHHLLRFENTINEIPLERVLEVSYEIPPADPPAQLFNYGTVYVKTAGEAANLSLDLMPKPQFIQQEIFAQRDEKRQRLEERHETAIKDEIQRALGMSADSQATGEQSSVRSLEPIGWPLIRTRFMNANGEVVWRRHSSVWLEHIFFPFLIMCAGLALPFLAGFIPDFPSGGVAFGLGMVILIVGGIWFYLSDWDWRNDMFILGDETLTLIHKRPFFLQNEVQRVRLAQVDNVVSDVSGVLNNILNRGDVRVSLIGSTELKVFDKVYDPAEMQSEISRRQAAFKARSQEGEVRSQRQAIADYLAVYHQSIAGAGAAGTPSIAPRFDPQAASAPTFNANPPAAQNAPYFDTSGGLGATQAPVEAPPPRDNMRPPRIPRKRLGE